MIRCTIILGMHRSGTSLLTGCYVADGWSIGRSVMQRGFDNPTGFFENERIVQLNDQLLSEFRSRWDEPRQIDWTSVSRDQKHAQVLRIQQLIKSEYKGAPEIIIKDPRVLLLLPLWQQAMEGLDIDLEWVVMLRHPDEIASSLYQRNFISSEVGLALTEIYWSQIFLHLSNDYKVVTYHDLLSQPKVVLEKLNLENAKLQIDPSLRHYNVVVEQYDQRNVIELYNRFRGRQDGTKDVNSILSKAYANIKDWKQQELNKCKVLWKSDGGYREDLSKTINIVNNTIKITDELNDQKGIKEVMIQLNRPCILSIETLQILTSSSYRISHNALNQDVKQLQFDIEYPRILISMEKIVSRVGLDVVFKIGDPFTPKLEIKPTDRTFLGAIAVAVRHPVRFLKNLNWRNLQTLRSALRRESPKVIMRNFVKLLKRPDQQKEIEAYTQEVKSDLLIEGDRVLSLPKLAKPFSSDGELKKNILYVTPVFPKYDESSGGKRATNYLQMLAQQHKVTIYCEETVDKKYIDLFTNQGIEIVQTASKNEKIDIILYAWYYAYYDYKHLRKLYPSALQIIDTVDVHWRREERARDYNNDLTPEIVAKNKKRELEAYSQVDHLWVVTDEDKKAIRSELENVEMTIVPNIHYSGYPSYLDRVASNLLFFGSFNHHPNVEAIQWMVQEILPLIVAQRPDVQLIIAGSNASAEVLSLVKDVPNVSFIGYVEEEEVASLYHQSLICFAPLLSGAGMKGKITEAINYHCPVVTTTIGNEGIDLIDGISGFIADDKYGLADRVISICSGDHDLESITAQAKIQLDKVLHQEHLMDDINRSLCRSVDICIVTWNRLDLLRDCIQSIFDQTIHLNYNILIHSNGCTDGTVEYVQKLQETHPNVYLYMSTANTGYVQPNNEMMNVNAKRDVILLNNDTVVTHGWLSHLVDVAYLDTKIGITGAQLYYPNGQLQESGSILYDDGYGKNYGKGESELESDFQKRRYVPYVSGAAMFIKRSTLEEIGGFDLAFSPAYYEDSDLCYRAWEHDQRVVVVPESKVIHIEGATAGTSTESGYKKYQEENRETFLQRHPTVSKINKKIKKLNYKTPLT